MTRKVLLPLLLCLFLFSGCSTVRVSQDYFNSAQLRGLQTFSWHPRSINYGEDDRESSPLQHIRFHDIIQHVFQEKGYQFSDKPDFLITYSYTIRTKIESYPYSTYYGPTIWSRHYRGGFILRSGPDIYEYDVGTLVIDVYDRATDSILWRGKGSQRVSAHSTPEEKTAMVDIMVREILQQFPPG